MERSSFTLMELLIVVAIIGILTLIAIPNFLNASIKAKVSSTYVRMKTVHVALNDYMLDYNIIPPSDFFSAQAFVRLTTPVSYLSFIDPCEDVLRRGFLEPNDILSENVSKFFFMYDASPAYAWITHHHSDGSSSDERIISGAFNREIRCMLSSAGPDGYGIGFQVIQLYSENHLDVMNKIYSTSNGLFSTGDIVSTNLYIYQ